MPDTREEQLTKHLTDVHSIEVQALQQLRVAPRMARDPQLARAFRDHLVETEEQERRVRGRLQAAAVARSIRDEEATMAERLAAGFDRAVEASLREVAPEDLGRQLGKYLADAFAIESQALQLLEQGQAIAGEPDLKKVFADHLDETRVQQAAIRSRIEARGERPSRFKSVLLRVGGVNLGAFFGLQPDTPAKLAGFAFAFEHLEIAAYEQLLRVARRAGDDQTARIAERIVGEERAAAAAIRARFEPTVDAALSAQGVS